MVPDAGTLRPEIFSMTTDDEDTPFGSQSRFSIIRTIEYRVLVLCRMSDYAAWLLRTILPLSSYGFLPTRRVSNVSDNAVVVVGCDTGMGRALVMRLGQNLKVRRVYAGCFTDDARQELENYSWCRTFSIDVRNVESVAASAQLIRNEEPNGVFAVVNVAGAM
jgi:hypothetical protein